MSDPALGSDVLLLVNTGNVASPVWTEVGCQRGLDITENNEFADTSCKNSGNRTGLPGRYSASITLDAVYLYDDNAYTALKNAQRNRQVIQVMVKRTGVNIEYASAVIASMARSYPDQEVRTLSVTLEITGGWTAAP